MPPSQIGEIIEIGREAREKDRIRQLAVERLLEIIGEAANSLSEDFRARYPGSGDYGDCALTFTITSRNPSLDLSASAR